MSVAHRVRLVSEAVLQISPSDLTLSPLRSDEARDRPAVPRDTCDALAVGRPNCVCVSQESRKGW